MTRQTYNIDFPRAQRIGQGYIMERDILINTDTNCRGSYPAVLFIVISFTLLNKIGHQQSVLGHQRWDFPGQHHFLRRLLTIYLTFNITGRYMHIAHLYVLLCYHVDLYVIYSSPTNMCFFCCSIVLTCYCPHNMFHVIVEIKCYTL